MRKIQPGFLLPSAAFAVPRARIRYCDTVAKAPEVGDLAFGSIAYIGQHSTLENKEGRIHLINDKTKAVFVFGNRYAPDYYEGTLPDNFPKTIHLISRSGIVGEVRCKNSMVKDPTRIKLEAYVTDQSGNVLNTRNFSRIVPKRTDKTPRRSKMILNVGTSMNSGKSTTAAACCWALSSMGHTVRGSKVTGTAGLKDILLMEDNGASPVADFSYLGYPSTYLLDRAELLGIFNKLDLKYANSPKNFWVVEIADGLLQRETAMLLQSEEVRSRIHRLIFSSHDAFGAIGGLQILEKEFQLTPHAISGICSSSPLSMREVSRYTDLPIFSNLQRNLDLMSSILL